MLSSTAGITIFLITPTMTGIYILLVLYGLGYGSYTLMDTVIRGRYFGRKSYSAIQSFSMLPAMPLAFLAPIFTGWVYDTTGAYTLYIFCHTGGCRRIDHVPVAHTRTCSKQNLIDKLLRSVSRIVKLHD